MTNLTPEQIAALRMVADHKTIIHNHDTTIVEVGARNALHAELVGLDLPDLAALALRGYEAQEAEKRKQAELNKPLPKGCNRHIDCEASKSKAAAEGRRTDCCHDECCEECFGS